ncbi:PHOSPHATIDYLINOSITOL 4-KINASE GAMMA 8 [Salix koriyanagi]|uniref:1-phosphatidylinositol 4-kinase n=1 Tax=Salix koriyanagi TaxID=2511006 RepID=A0A9Q0VF63_9ROSI|nr:PHOSPHATIDYLINOSITOL 4-KINASE GAMMA 8 [Salix koriyanagi]
MRFNKMAVVIDQNHGFKPFKRSQRCRLQSLTNFDVNILDIDQTNLSSLKKAFEVVKFHRSFSSPCFSLATRVEEEVDTTPRIEILGGHGAPRVRALVVEVAIALASGVDPIPVSSGLGGAYILRSRNGNNIALAKPVDEEPLAFNNPKGFRGADAWPTCVPPTALVRISHVGFHVNGAENISAPPWKIASLQRFVEHEFDAGELGSSGFSVASVHQIAIFDVRVLNLDRHAGNILVIKNDQKEKYAAGAAELVPIDHGLCLPEWLDDPYFEWLHWPQALVPFSESELVYISNLDPFKDAELLRSELSSLRESSIRVLVLCTIFLKQAAAAGLCLAGIGKMMTRESCSGEENAKEAIVNASDGEEDNIDSREEKDEFELFQFDKETVHTSADVMHLHQLLQSPPEIAKPPKIAKFSPVRSLPRSQDEELSPLFEETGHEVKTRNDGDESNRTFKENGGDSNGDDSKQGGLTRSKSYSVRNRACESEGISFGDLSEGEWKLFLECFEKLLLEVLESSKCGSLKHRLGTSCQF